MIFLLLFQGASSAPATPGATLGRPPYVLSITSPGASLAITSPGAVLAITSPGNSLAFED